VTAAALGQIGWIARRSVRRTLRQPAMIVPTLVFPLFLLAVNSGGLNAATKLPGFPTDSYVSFALAVTFMQGALFAAVNAGMEIAGDIESGFLNRLALTPLRGVAVLVGQLGGAILLSVLASFVYLTVGLLAGAHVVAGAGGVVVVLLLSVLIGVAFGGLGALLAMRTGSTEAVQGAFPLLFTLFFLSSINLPRRFIPVDWFRTVATYNPVSYLVEAIRSLIVSGWDGTALIKGVVVGVAMAAVCFTAAAAALRTRLTRT
jgi:ABC-2 type transport system permease protein